MRLLAVLTQPWCFAILLLLIVLLLLGAALTARSRARSATTLGKTMRAQELAPRHDLVATAPWEGLQALGERLAELQRHLPPQSDDERWLQGFRNDLRNVQDDVYWHLFHMSEAERAALLARLCLEVGRLEHTIGARLSITFGAATDREALHAQLDQLRRAINS